MPQLTTRKEESLALGSDWLVFQAQYCRILAVLPWPSHWSSLSSCFLRSAAVKTMREAVTDN